MDYRVHGGPDDGELQALGLTRSEILDFSASTNPWGPSETMLATLRNVSVGRYPDSGAREATGVLACQLNIPAERLVLGNGAAELLWTLRAVVPGLSQGVVIAEPTFCEFRAACSVAEVPVFEWRAREGDGFQIDLSAIAEVATQRKVNVVYVCCPNTPTGTTLPAKALARWAEEHPRLWIIIDQSFLSLSEHFREVAQLMPDNVICVRSLTKEHGIPGVRVGYLVAAPAIAQAVERVRPAWTVSSYAQAAAIASEGEQAFVSSCREQLLTNRKWLSEALRELELEPVPSSAPFLLVRVPEAVQVRHALLQRHKLLVRDCSSFGLPGYLRLSVRDRPSLLRLVAALGQELFSTT